MAAARLQMLLKHNSAFAETYKAPGPFLELQKKMRGSELGGFAILTCSDPRLMPGTWFGTDSPVKPAVIQNAGGRASDAIRTINALNSVGKLGTLIVVHHTDCGMSHQTEEQFRDTVKSISPENADEIDKIVFGAIEDVNQTVRDDVAFLKASPLMKKKELLIKGFVLDTFTGKLEEVEA